MVAEYGEAKMSQSGGCGKTTTWKKTSAGYEARREAQLGSRVYVRISQLPNTMPLAAIKFACGESDSRSRDDSPKTKSEISDLRCSLTRVEVHLLAT